MLEMIDVSKIYPGGSVALQDINVRIEQGEFVFIVGPSGAGKSTFFKMLFREVLPSSGKVIVNGHDLVKMTDKEIPYFRRQLGIVFQDYRLLPDRTYMTMLLLQCRLSKLRTAKSNAALTMCLTL